MVEEVQVEVILAVEPIQVVLQEEELEEHLLVLKEAASALLDIYPHVG